MFAGFLLFFLHVRVFLKYLFVCFVLFLSISWFLSFCCCFCFLKNSQLITKVGKNRLKLIWGKINLKSANNSRHSHDFPKTWSTESLLAQLICRVCYFWVNSPKSVFFFTPIRLRVETSFSLSRTTSWRLFMRKRRCSEDTGLQMYVYS